jgi:hypothetical protein
MAFSALNQGRATRLTKKTEKSRKIPLDFGSESFPAHPIGRSEIGGWEAQPGKRSRARGGCHAVHDGATLVI